MSEKLKTYIAEQISQHMEERLLTHHGLAKEIGVGIAQVKRVINCENYTIDTLIKMLKYLELQIESSNEK